MGDSPRAIRNLGRFVRLRKGRDKAKARDKTLNVSHRAAPGHVVALAHHGLYYSFCRYCGEKVYVEWDSSTWWHAEEWKT